MEQGRLVATTDDSVNTWTISKLFTGHKKGGGYVRFDTRRYLEHKHLSRDFIFHTLPGAVGAFLFLLNSWELTLEKAPVF